MNPETPTDLSRKEKQRRWHRRLMLEAAEKLFSRQGYHSSSMQEIAEEAEFSVGYLYKMFDSKEDLYRHLISARIEEYCQEAFEYMAQQESPVDKIRAVIRCKFEFFNKHLQFFRIFANFVDASETAFPRTVNPESNEKYKEYQKTLEQTFAAGSADGDFRDISPTLGVLALEGTTNEVIKRKIHNRATSIESLDPKNIENLLFRGLLAKRNNE